MNSNTSKLFFNVLDEKRSDVLEKVRPLLSKWYLAGGTGLALQIGHRISYDFDYFSQQEVDPTLRLNLVKIFGNKLQVSMDTKEQLTVFTPNQVKITFAKTPYAPIYPLLSQDGLQIENVTDIAADKAFTIGRRGVLRDYVDLFFILASKIALPTIISDADKKYGAMFSEKLFLEQLDYMEDIEDTTIEYLSNPITKEKIKTELHRAVRTYLQEQQAALT